MRWRDVNFNPDQRILCQFGGILTLIGFVTTARQVMVFHHPVSATLLGLGTIIVAVISLFRPSWLKFIFVASVVVTFPIGWLVSNLILLLLFFGLMTPIAIVFRWSGRDLLNLKPASDDESTFWIPKAICQNKRGYFKQF